MIIEVYHLPNANLQAGVAEREGGSGVYTLTQSARGLSPPKIDAVPNSISLNRSKYSNRMLSL